jgi:hypothetical protein
MKYVISTMPAHELAERIGSLTSEAETERFRRLAINAGFGNCTTSDISDADWDHLITQITQEDAR